LAASKSAKDIKGAGDTAEKEVEGVANAAVKGATMKAKCGICNGEAKLEADQALKFQGTKALAARDAEGRVSNIKDNTADAGARSVSAANSEASKAAMEASAKQTSAWKKAEFEMQNAVKVSSSAAKHSSDQWKKAIGYADAGRTFAVEAISEAKKAQREAHEAINEVNDGLSHAMINTQASQLGSNKATMARDAAASSKYFVDKVHTQVNATKAGITQTSIDLDTIIADSVFAAKEAKQAFMYAKAIKDSAPKKVAVEAAGPPSSGAQDSEDAN